MYNQPNYPGIGYDQMMYYNPQNQGYYEEAMELRELDHEEYRPDDGRRHHLHHRHHHYRQHSLHLHK